MRSRRKNNRNKPEKQTQPKVCVCVLKRRRENLNAHQRSLPGDQSRGFSLEGLQSLLDLQQGLHGPGIGEDGERLWVLHLLGDKQRRQQEKQEGASKLQLGPACHLSSRHGASSPRSVNLTHLLQKYRELQAELLLKLWIPRKQRHIHHHLHSEGGRKA